MDTIQEEGGGRQIRSAIGLELHVRDVMTREVLVVTKYESITKVANILSGKNISGLPVVDNDRKVLGIVTQADILSMLGVGREHTFKDLLKYMLGERLPKRKMGDLVGDIMTTAVITITPDANIADAARLMDDKKIRRLIVTDEHQALLGIITRADILKAVIKKLK